MAGRANHKFPLEVQLLFVCVLLTLVSFPRSVCAGSCGDEPWLLELELVRTAFGERVVLQFRLGGGGVRFSTEALLIEDQNSGRAGNLIGAFMGGSVGGAVASRLLVVELRPSVQVAYLVDETSQVRRPVPLYDSNESWYAAKLVVAEAGLTETGFLADASGAHELRWLTRRRDGPAQPHEEGVAIRDE